MNYNHMENLEQPKMCLCLSTCLYQFIDCFLFSLHLSLSSSLACVLAASLRHGQTGNTCVISPLFVCLHECRAKDREGTNTTVHTLIPL